MRSYGWQLFQRSDRIIAASTEAHVPEYPEDLVVVIDAAHDNEVEVVDQMLRDSEDLDKDVRMLVGRFNWSNIVVGDRGGEGCSDMARG